VPSSRVVWLVKGWELTGGLHLEHSLRLRADLLTASWVPFLIVCWSAVSASQAALQTKTQYYAIRAILGLLMGGFIP
jgi:hypothetical protein